jgi:gluconolactonase
MNPDTFLCLSDEFADIVGDSSGVRLLQGGFEFLEGPVWSPAAGGLVFSDIPADTMYLWRDGEACSVFRKPSRHANGNTLDPAGRILTCEHGARRVTRTEDDGNITVLAETYAGRRLNSPNDITVQSDGTVWFTDPPYGIEPEQQEQAGRFVFRLTSDGALDAVLTDFIKPNGIALSPDEKTLYVSDTEDMRHHIRAFRLRDGRTPVDGEIFRIIGPGKSDGFRVDEDGRIFTSSGEGIWVLSPTGVLLGKIMVPEVPANCAFGGADGRTLFITARTGLYAVDLSVRGYSVARGIWT